MEKKLNFSKNYNSKLFCNYFTTIRSLETIKEKDLNDGDNVKIQWDYVTIHIAKIVSIEVINLEHLSFSQMTLLMLDCGCNYDKAIDIIKNYCKSNKVALITLFKND